MAQRSHNIVQPWFSSYQRVRGVVEDENGKEGQVYDNERRLWVVSTQCYIQTLEKCTPDTYIMLLTNYTPIYLIFLKYTFFQHLPHIPNLFTSSELTFLSVSASKPLSYFSGIRYYLLWPYAITSHSPFNSTLWMEKAVFLKENGYNVLLHVAIVQNVTMIHFVPVFWMNEVQTF